MLRNYLGFEMKITERDIFNFVFFKENLTVEKMEYLKHSKEFVEEIDFYLSLKQSFDVELNDDIKQRIANKISVYVPSKIFLLFPIEKQIKRRLNNKSVLAAATSETSAEFEVKTYIDENKQYLVRLLNSKNHSKIYVFSTSEEVLRNFQVIIKPSGQKFEQSNNYSPIELDKPLQADNILLKFN